MRLVSLSVSGAIAAALSAAPAPTPQQRPAADVAVVDRFLSATDAPLVSYRAVRRLHAEARGGKMRATLQAATTLDPERGFTYEVVEEAGSGVIRLGSARGSGG
jgi:hypothetical protein